MRWLVIVMAIGCVSDIAAAKSLSLYYDAYGGPHGGSVGAEIKLTRKLALGPFMTLAQSETSIETTYKNEADHKVFSVAGAGLRANYKLTGRHAYSSGWYISGFASRYSIDEATEFGGELYTQSGLRFVNYGSTIGYQIKAGFLFGRIGAGMLRTYASKKDGTPGQAAATLPAFDLSIGVAI